MACPTWMSNYLCFLKKQQVAGNDWRKRQVVHFGCGLGAQEGANCEENPVSPCR